MRYAMVVHGFYIPLLRDGTEEEAVQAALEYIWSGDVAYDDGDLGFEIIKIADTHDYTTADYQDFFEKKVAEARRHQQIQQEKNDRAQFERLQKKFAKCTCREKEVDKTNCPIHNEFGS